MNNKKKSPENPNPDLSKDAQKETCNNEGNTLHKAIPSAPPSKTFDPRRFRMDQAFQSAVTQVVTMVRVGKPTREQFVRVNPDIDRRLVGVAVIDSKEEGPYLVDQSVQDALIAETKVKALYEAITRQGTLFIWPVDMAGPDGKLNPWHESMQAAIDLAQAKWVRIVADMEMGGYRTYMAQGELGEPAWPAKPFHELLEVAFKGRVITSLDHPMVRKLWGK